MTAQILDVAREIGIPPDADEGAAAELIDHARVGLQIRAGGQHYTVEHGVVLEALGHEGADPAAAEDVIHEEGRLAESPAVLELFEVQVLEAAEGAGLEVAEAINQADIELPFLRRAGVVHVLTL